MVVLLGPSDYVIKRLQMYVLPYVRTCTYVQIFRPILMKLGVWADVH